MKYQTDINPQPAFVSRKIDYKACSNCSLPVERSIDEHCFFCKKAGEDEFKSRTKLMIATAI